MEVANPLMEEEGGEYKMSGNGNKHYEKMERIVDKMVIGIPPEEQEKMNAVGLEVLKDHVADSNDAATTEAYEMYLEFLEGSEYLGWID